MESHSLSIIHYQLSIMLTVGHFLEALAPSEPYQTSGAEPMVLSVVIDSREADLGSLFVAFVGEQVDGHDYVDAAFERGAVAAIVERPLPHHTLPAYHQDESQGFRIRLDHLGRG